MTEWTEQLTRLLRESVNASVEAAVKFQEQTWRMVDELVQRGALAKDEAKRLLDAWTLCVCVSSGAELGLRRSGHDR